MTKQERMARIQSKSESIRLEKAGQLAMKSLLHLDFKNLVESVKIACSKTYYFDRYEENERNPMPYNIDCNTLHERVN